MFAPEFFALNHFPGEFFPPNGGEVADAASISGASPVLNIPIRDVDSENALAEEEQLIEMLMQHMPQILEMMDG